MTELNELKLNYHISIRNIRGETDDSISNCYGKSCANIGNTQKRKICKEECHQSVLNDAISKLSGLVSKCNYADHPSACRGAVARLIKTYKDRIKTSQGRLRDAKVEILSSNAIKRRK
jgi:hypothetical protein